MSRKYLYWKTSPVVIGFKNLHEIFSHRKINIWFLSNLIQYDCTESFSFDYEPNRFCLVCNQKENCQYDRIPYNSEGVNVPRNLKRVAEKEEGDSETLRFFKEGCRKRGGRQRDIEIF